MYPLKFEPIYKSYIWGGRGLEKIGKKLQSGTVAESWEISAYPESESIVSKGEYKGKKLTELVGKFKEELLGKELLGNGIEKFPLLIKFIDANDKLSVQVHPKEAYARIHENGENGKNEMWYIISAKPDAKIVYGVAAGVTKENFSESIKDHRIEECLNYINVNAGDFFIIPAGLVHAIGEGITLAEIQQNSNTTYRVFDYDRTDKNDIKRTLHIEKALDVIDFSNCNIERSSKGLEIKLQKGFSQTYMTANKYFSVERYEIQGKINEDADGSRFYAYTCLSGEGQINYCHGKETISEGESILIPASLGRFSFEGELQLLKAYVPHIEKNVVEPLLKAGYTRKEIFNSVINMKLE